MELLPGELDYNLIFDVDGKPDYFVTQVLDITERKKAEKALQRQTEELTTIIRSGKNSRVHLHFWLRKSNLRESLISSAMSSGFYSLS